MTRSTTCLKYGTVWGFVVCSSGLVYVVVHMYSEIDGKQLSVCVCGVWCVVCVVCVCVRMAVCENGRHIITDSA